ncbi:MAG TPA: formate dehydrogenase accessory sulfurtransferase FdhD [Euzebyales bacterium]|nr:formate dehydrogenase accessory sulfurtransferase FdhD [Euzebyales bacterium]
MAERVVVRRRIRKVEGAANRPAVDSLAAEEPLEIRVGGEAVAVTMRTPGADFELAAGFCLTEGMVAAPDDIVHIRYCAGTDPETGLQTYNVVDLALRGGGTVAPDLRRNVYTTSSCGICGSASIDAIRRTHADIDDDVRVPAEVVAGLPDTMRDAQRVFARTGGLHAAARFDAGGVLLDLQEDVGRHNAVDKLVGRAALQGALPLAGQVLMLSGRVAFEIVQKALRARIPVIAAVSAPTSLAVEAAAKAGMTLVGFVRGDRMNIYCGGDRIV